MVSGGQVRSDKDNVSSYCSNYTSTVDGLSSSWKGSSYDSLSTQSQTVSSDVLSIIISEMDAFASACDLYEKYMTAKANKAQAQANWNDAKNRKAHTEASGYAADISAFDTEMNTLRDEINQKLDAASNGKIDATSVSASVTSVGGATSSSSSVVQGAIDWAVAVAADNSHGYSQNTRWGNPNYDCSSLVISAYENAGINVKEVGASYTGNMRSAFTKVGFEWIPGTPNVNSLQPGDVLLNEGHHTELYIGDGMNVGAHSDYDGKNGDSSGKEISVENYSNKNWDGILRYVGTDNTNRTVSA